MNEPTADAPVVDEKVLMQEHHDKLMAALPEEQREVVENLSRSLEATLAEYLVRGGSLSLPEALSDLVANTSHLVHKGENEGSLNPERAKEAVAVLDVASRAIEIQSMGGDAIPANVVLPVEKSMSLARGLEIIGQVGKPLGDGKVEVAGKGIAGQVEQRILVDLKSQ